MQRVAIPYAEFACGKFVGHLYLNLLCFLRSFRLGNDAVVARLRVAHRHHRTTTRQNQTSIVDVAPSHTGKLAVVGIAPQCLANVVVPTPWLLSKEHRWFLAIRLQRICSTDVIPVDNLGCSTDDVVHIEAFHNGDEAIETREIHVVFAVPNGLAHVFCHLALLWGKLYFAERVGTNGVERILKFRVLLHPLEKVHLLTAPVTEAM